MDSGVDRIRCLWYDGSVMANIQQHKAATHSPYVLVFAFILALAAISASQALTVPAFVLALVAFPFTEDWRNYAYGATGLVERGLHSAAPIDFSRLRRLVGQWMQRRRWTLRTAAMRYRNSVSST